MSAHLSPDGQWWWDGSQWISAVSPDGRWRWDGARWIPNGPTPSTASFRHALVPTMDTRPVQTAVIAFVVVSAAASVFTLATYTDGIAFALIGHLVLAVGAGFRWRWTYYVVMFFGFVAILPTIANVIALAMNSQSPHAPASFVEVMVGLAYVGLATWMYRLRRDHGTAWAMRHITAPA